LTNGTASIKNLLHSKGNDNQNQKRVYRMRENPCQLFIIWRINIQNTQRAQKLKARRTNYLINKWANELNRQFSKRRSTKDQ
jgi:hypothetical protein